MKTYNQIIEDIYYQRKVSEKDLITALLLANQMNKELIRSLSRIQNDDYTGAASIQKRHSEVETTLVNHKKLMKHDLNDEVLKYKLIKYLDLDYKPNFSYGLRGNN